MRHGRRLDGAEEVSVGILCGVVYRGEPLLGHGGSMWAVGTLATSIVMRSRGKVVDDTTQCGYRVGVAKVSRVLVGLGLASPAELIEHLMQAPFIGHSRHDAA